MPRTKRRVCDGKQAHRTEEAAKNHMRSLIRGGSFVPTIRAYKCKFCQLWHVGHVGLGRKNK